MAADINTIKQFFKDATDSEALKAYEWAMMAMEFRGLVQIPGTRKRRSDAGQPRNGADIAQLSGQAAPALRERIAGMLGDVNAAQPSLSGLPDENTTGE